MKYFNQLNELERKFVETMNIQTRDLQRLSQTLEAFKRGLNPKKEELEKLTEFYDNQLSYSLRYFGRF